MCQVTGKIKSFRRCLFYHFSHTSYRGSLYWGSTVSGSRRYVGWVSFHSFHFTRPEKFCRWFREGHRWIDDCYLCETLAACTSSHRRARQFGLLSADVCDVDWNLAAYYWWLLLRPSTLVSPSQGRLQDRVVQKVPCRPSCRRNYQPTRSWLCRNIRLAQQRIVWGFCTCLQKPPPPPPPPPPPLPPRLQLLTQL